CIRACPWLEGATAHQARTGGLDSGRSSAHLRGRFHRAWPGNDLHRGAADRHATDVDDRVRTVPFAGNDLVLLDDVHRFLDARHGVEHLWIELALIAHRADKRAFGSARDVNLKAVGPYFRLDGLDGRLVGVWLHDDDHGRTSQKDRAAPGPPDCACNARICC